MGNVDEAIDMVMEIFPQMQGYEQLMKKVINGVQDQLIHTNHAIVAIRDELDGLMQISQQLSNTPLYNVTRRYFLSFQLLLRFKGTIKL